MQRSTDVEVSMPPIARRHRPVAVIVISAILCLLAANALFQAVGSLAGWNSDPAPLTAFQFASGGLALASAIGTWRHETWASSAAVLYGVVTGLMIVSLGSILGLDESARIGLRAGAALMLTIGLGLAYFIRRVQPR